MSLEQMNAKNIEPKGVDLEYINKIRLGDPEAFSALFRKYYEPLYQFAGRFVKEHQIAESLVQDVFVKIWSNREKLSIKLNVKSYLYTAVKNHALNYLKHEKIVVIESEEVDYQNSYNRTPEEELIESEMHEAVHKAIENLPQQCRQIYLMKRYDNLSYSEIADVLNISINTVKTQMKRALKSLRKNLSHLFFLIV